jgi:CheY-like chemotaxis protein
MALVLALTADLLFGSQVQGALAAAGHEVRLLGDEDALAGALADAGGPAALLVDLTDALLDGAGALERLCADGRLGAQVRTLAYYSHVEVEARRRAEQAGFDLVVPRSRMAREGAELVASLLGAASDPV